MRLFASYGRPLTGFLPALVLVSFTLTANNIKLSNKTNSFKITENTGQGFTVSFSFSEFSSIDVKSPIGTFSRIIVPSYAQSGIFGHPELPVKSELIEIPVNAEARVRIVDFDVKEYKLRDLGVNYQIMPNQPPVPKTGEPVGFIYEKGAYSIDAFIANEIASVRHLGTMRGVNIGRLDIMPVQYNPVTGADTYTWVVSPPEAGYITGCDESGIIVWNRDFTGTAAISAMAQNACRASVPSKEILVIMENSTVSIDESEKANFSIYIYPNPSDGVFNVLINGADPEDVVIKHVDLTGRVCIPGSSLNPGIYLLIAETGIQRVIRKLIIR